MRNIDEIFGFTQEDVRANRKGHFSAHQQAQMNALINDTLRPLALFGAGMTIAVIAAVLLVQAVLGDNALTRVISLVLSAMLFIMLVFGGYMLLSLSRARRRAQVHSVTGRLQRRLGEGSTLELMIDDTPILITIEDRQAAFDALEEGAIYSVYYMGQPPAASVLSLEKRRGG
ncbi:MAG: hypothetical protein ACOCXZ_02275 [Chloroflexota bacterium]